MTDATPFPLPRSVRQTDVLSGNGGTVYGPFGFKIFDIADVEVWTRPADAVGFAKASVTVAKVSGLDFDTFTVTFAAALPVTTEFVVRAVRLAERSAGVKSGTKLDATALEKEFSKIAATDQELRRDIDRAVRSEFGDAALTLAGDLSDGDTLMKDGNRLVAGPNFMEAVERAEEAADRAAGYVSDAVSQGNVPLFSAFDALSGVVLPDGLLSARVAGRAITGDGGDGLILVSDADLGGPDGLKGRSAAPDGTPGMGKFLRYINQSELSVEKFGVNLYNSAADQTVKMQSAIASGKNLLIPAGTFIETGTLAMVENGQSIRGEGISGAENTHTGLRHPGGTDNLIEIIPSSGFWTGNALSNLYIDGSQQTGGDIIRESHVQRGNYRDILINAPMRGVWADDFNSPVWYNVRVIRARGTYAWRMMGRADGKSDVFKMLFCTGSGTGLHFDDPDVGSANNETIALWLDGYVYGGLIQFFTTQGARNTIYASADPADPVGYPAGMTLIRCGGDYPMGANYYLEAAAEWKIFHAYVSNNQGTSAQAHSGDGVYIGEGARDIDWINLYSISARDNGVYCAGENIRFFNSKICRANVRGETGSNVKLTSTAKGIQFQSCTIGHNLYNTGSGLPTDGRALYGIELTSTLDPGELLISSDCDFRGNAIAAINRPEYALFPGGTPRGVPKPGADRCDNGDFRVNQLAVADGAITGNARVRDRWFAGSSGLTLATESDGAITISTGSSIYQTDVDNVVAGKRVWMAAEVKRGSGTAGTFTTKLHIGTNNKVLTTKVPADNGYNWVVYAVTVSSLETGNIQMKVESGSVPLTIRRVRYGFGDVPDTFGPDRSPADQETACGDFLRILRSDGTYGSFASGFGISATTGRVFFDLGRPLKAVPLASGGVSYSGAVEVQFGNAGVADISAVSFATGGRTKRRPTVHVTTTGISENLPIQLRAKNDSAAFIKLDTGF